MESGRRRFLALTAMSMAALALSWRARAADVAPALEAQRLAWAGVRLRLGQDELFIDPLVNADVWGSALKDPIIPVEGRAGARFVLITHRHPDHFDPQAVRRIIGDSGGAVVCTQDNAAAVAAAGFKVRVGGLYEPLLLNDFTATAVPAADGYGDPQVSWVVGAGGRRIIHCGDTLWHGAWWHIGRQLGPFDAAFLPINGARFAWRKPVSGVPAVLTPEQAVAAARILDARVIVPIHYGVAGAEGYEEMPHAEADLRKLAQLRGQGVEVVLPGEWLRWRADT